MKEGEYRVWNLLDEDDRLEAVAHVEEQIAETERDLELIGQTDRALAEIQRLLLEMKEIAQEAAAPGADRKALAARFESMRMRIDLVAAQHRAGLSAEDTARIRALTEGLRDVQL